MSSHRKPRTRHRINPERITRRCETQKVCYSSHAEALEAAERQMEEGRVKPGCHLTPYACERCRYLHLSNRRIVPLNDPAYRAVTEDR